MDWLERTEMLVGAEALRRMASSSVAVVGLGGVGAFAAEMLVRSGLGHIVLIDCDTVSVSNKNRQLIALDSTIGRGKGEVLGSRLLDINPDLYTEIRNEYVSEESIPAIFDGMAPDYVVDAIDTLSPKIALIQYCLNNGIPVVSSMGSGAKTDVTRVRIADISKTYQCPLAHMLRKRLHKLGITTGFQAVFSDEIPVRESVLLEESRNKKSQVGSISYLPAVFGCACAQVVLKQIMGI